ncbi:hypothetical protein ACSFE6_18725 [Pseudomonas baetica]|uniref:hypothetical protein n=1 Tax=Pseudomonas baetica TaxID=674054 RepID=UPI003EEC351B
MMVEYFGSHWLAILFLGSPFVMAIFSLGFAFYLSRRYLDAMIEALPNSRYLYVWGPFLRRPGWFERFWLMNSIAAMVVWAPIHIRSGEIDPVDIQKFPAHLKRLVLIDIALLYGAVIWMLVVYVLSK